MIKIKGYLTTHEVAEIFCVDVQTVRNWIRIGVLPAFKLRKNYFISVEDVMNLEERYKKNVFD